MTSNVRDFVEDVAASLEPPGPVFEIGSYQFLPTHEHPSDSWRFTAVQLLPHTVFGVGVKGPADAAAFEALRGRHTIDFRPSGLHVAIGPMALRPRELARLAAGQLGAPVVQRIERRGRAAA